MTLRNALILHSDSVDGLADLNNDGHPDVVIQYTDGSMGVWYLGGTQGNSDQWLRINRGPLDLVGSGGRRYGRRWPLGFDDSKHGRHAGRVVPGRRPGQSD